MLARTLVILSLLAAQLTLLAPSTAMARTISWSGYTWNVRPAGVGDPGANQWSDSDANVRVEGSDLVLSVVKDASGCWASAEVDNQQHLGYGTYRWVVASDLSTLEAHDVLGMFTYGGSSASHNEIDFEASQWGNRAWPNGSATVWQDAAAGRSDAHSFRYTARPPYVHQFRWEPGKVTFLVRDAAGATLLDRTFTREVPTPSEEVPMINLWRYDNAPPDGPRSVRIASFAWIPLGEDDAPPLPEPFDGPAALGAPEVDAGAADPGCVRLAMSPRRFPVAGRGSGTTITWSATAAVRMVVERRLDAQRFVSVGTLRRAARRGAGRMRFRGRVAGRRLRPGRYRLVVRPSAGADRGRSARATLRFTVLAR